VVNCHDYDYEDRFKVGDSNVLMVVIAMTRANIALNSGLCVSHGNHITIPAHATLSSIK